MRIGDVSKKYNISKDSIYYYIDYGLLVPFKKDSHYFFDEKALADLELILELKNMRFSLKEIYEILSLYRISRLSDDQDLDEIIDKYINKRDECLKESIRLKNIATSIDKKISKLNLKNKNSTITGVPLNMLDLLICPICKRQINIKNANMNSKYIFEADLSCDCGYSMKISDGIILTPNKNTSLYDKPDLSRELYKDLPFKMISHFQKFYNYMLSKINSIDLSGKVVLETYVNAWCFIHNHINDLDETAKYIIIDKYPETLLMYKKIIENQNSNLDIMYIADSSTNFPLVENCIDVNFDFFAINEHNFYHDSFLIDRIKKYLKNDSDMIGIYFYYKNRNKSVRNLLEEYPESSLSTFDINYFMKSMKKNDCKMMDIQELPTICDVGNNLGFGFHEKGDKLNSICYHYHLKKI